MAPAESFDQTGFELTPVPLPADDHSGQQELFSDDCYQPDLSACTAQADAADREPVFWAEGAGQHQPDDDYLQPDVPE